MFLNFAFHFPKVVDALKHEGIDCLTKAVKKGEGIHFEDVTRLVPFWKIKSNRKIIMELR